MARNLLEQLGDAEIPPLPKDFDHQVHRRLNDRLLVVHLVELLISAFPMALAHFSCAVSALLRYSLSGNFPPPEDHGKTNSSP